MSMGVEFLVTMVLSWITTHWVSPDTRLGAVAVFFGVLFAFIFAYGLLGYARRQWGPVPPSHDDVKGIATETPEAQLAPTSDLSSRLYVGEMGIDAGKLAANRTLEIWVRCFNATGHSLWAHRIVGNIGVRWSEGGRTETLGKLPPPLILSERGKIENLADATEMFFVLEQRVPDNLAEKLLTVGETASAHLMFAENLDIILGSHDAAALQVKVPLWGGIRLYRSPNRILSSRILIMKIEPIKLTLGVETNGKA